MSKRGKLAYIREILQSYPGIKKKQIRTRQEQRRVEIVEQTLESIGKMKYSSSKLKIIQMVYFERSHTLNGAALEIPISERTAQRWNTELMEFMEEKMDLP